MEPFYGCSGVRASTGCLCVIYEKSPKLKYIISWASHGGLLDCDTVVLAEDFLRGFVHEIAPQQPPFDLLVTQVCRVGVVIKVRDAFDDDLSDGWLLVCRAFHLEQDHVLNAVFLTVYREVGFTAEEAFGFVDEVGNVELNHGVYVTS